MNKSGATVTVSDSEVVLIVGDGPDLKVLRLSWPEVVQLIEERGSGLSESEKSEAAKTLVTGT